MVQQLKELLALTTQSTTNSLRIERMRVVQHRLGDVCRNTVYSLVEAGELPPPIPITSSGRAVGWISRDIDAYIERCAQRMSLNRAAVLSMLQDDQTPVAANNIEAPSVVSDQVAKPAHTLDGARTTADEIDALLRGAK